ncbi:putative transcription regulator SWI/SNF-BAF60b family [Helianthus debilis subsp. tardiflorus]
MFNCLKAVNLHLEGSKVILRKQVLKFEIPRGLIMSRNENKEVKKKGGRFTKLCTLSPKLQKFTGVPELARTEVVKQLWSYIREHDLQDPANKRNIRCDEPLRELFDVDTIDMFQMNKALAKHIWPLNSDGGISSYYLQQLQSVQHQRKRSLRKKKQKGGSCAIVESSRGIGPIFADENLIRQVVFDGLREVETAVRQVIGKTPYDLTFARFANRYGRKYESSEEIKHRYSIFAESLETIRSHNKWLSYTLGVNAHEKLVNDYFSDEPLYNDEIFRHRFRMSRWLFTRIANDLAGLDPFFTQRPVARNYEVSSIEYIETSVRKVTPIGDASPLNLTLATMYS